MTDTGRRRTITRDSYYRSFNLDPDGDAMFDCDDCPQHARVAADCARIEARLAAHEDLIRKVEIAAAAAQPWISLIVAAVTAALAVLAGRIF